MPRIVSRRCLSTHGVGWPISRRGPRFSTWLTRIAINVALTKRKQAGTPHLDVDEPEIGVELDWTLDTPVEVAELEDAIGQLPEGARDVVVLCGIYGYSHLEAARILGVAEGTCRAQLHRARALLRQRLGLKEV